jgi:hypothetical protein
MVDELLYIGDRTFVVHDVFGAAWSVRAIADAAQIDAHDPRASARPRTRGLGPESHWPNVMLNRVVQQ